MLSTGNQLVKNPFLCERMAISLRELSLHILDIVQNSIAANATLIEIGIQVDTKKDLLTIYINDNGKGMTSQQLKDVDNPFYTSRTTRKVGLGLPLFKMSAQLAGGDLKVHSKVNVGTKVEATFEWSNIDRVPLGNLCETLTAIIRANGHLDFTYKEQFNEKEFLLNTKELRNHLDEVPIDNAGVISWIKKYYHENSPFKS